MSKAGMVTLFLGIFIVCSRTPLLLAPAATLRWFKEAIRTEARTRMFGAFMVPIAVLMMWAGRSENSNLADILFIFGVFILVIIASALILFPRAYMSIAEAFLPTDPFDNLFGWRIMGLLGVIIGAAIVMVGMNAL